MREFESPDHRKNLSTRVKPRESLVKELGREAVDRPKRNACISHRPPSTIY